MRNVIIQVREDRVMGELGLLLKGVKMIDAPMVSRSGDLIAHDLLEHQNGLKRIGSIDDELEALGGLWFVRGQFGTLRPNDFHGPVSGVAYDVANLGQYYCQGVDMRTRCPCTLPRNDETDVFESIADNARELLRAEMEYADEKDQRLDRQREFFGQVVHYMRRGWSKAKRRYKDDGGRANRQFWAIANEVDRLVPWIEYEGQEFSLRYGDGEAYVKER